MDNDKKRIFGERFTEMISGESYRKVAEKLDIGVSTVGHYAAGQRLPNLIVLKTIAAAYRVSADWLVGESDIKYIGEAPEINLKDLSEKKVQMAKRIAAMSDSEVDELEKAIIFLSSLKDK